MSTHMQRLRLWQEMLASVMLEQVASFTMLGNIGVAEFRHKAGGEPRLWLTYDLVHMLVASAHPTNPMAGAVQYLGDSQYQTYESRFLPGKRVLTWEELTQQQKEAMTLLRKTVPPHDDTQRYWAMLEKA